MKKKLLIALAILLAIQLFRIDKTNKPINKKLDYVSLTHAPKNIEKILEKSCYNCHSNQTIYPWYANVAPISWLVKSHINEGKKFINFSEYGLYNVYQKDHINKGLYEVIKNGRMPLSSYLLLHQEDNLSNEQRQELLNWFSIILNKKNSIK
ncbi:cytochrome C [Apibacter muscae]|uniref:heme-binding domain-containing protein n=1 Tax=Apibacter muscae TaxID=2509004 RepID=UPI0011ACD870|nr:heme-binding domain-containing protein [Apibacter muscae]TWP28046.1 cytochrome C [Apibacter muscae]